MIIPDKKKAAGMILAKMGKPDSMEVKAEEEIDSADIGLKTAAEEVMQAMESKSPHDLMVALKSFWDQCEGVEHEAEEEESY